MSAETLRRAAEIVRERGLAKGVYEDRDGRVCVFGALACAHYGRVSTALAEGREVEEDVWVLRDVLHPDYGVTDWNDEPARTADEVIAALEAAAARLEGEARP